MELSWRRWSDDVLNEAAACRRPVLLSIVAGWCRFCRAMDRLTWAHPEVQAAVAEQVIPVRLDKDTHAAIAARFHHGGWPGTVLLSPSGEVLVDDTFLGPGELLGRLRQAVGRLSGDGTGTGPASPSPGSGALDPAILPAVEHSLLAGFDECYGGFGTGQKFPHPEAIDFAILRLSERDDPRLREVVEKTLVRMAEGGLQDGIQGGFFRFSARRDWRRPNTEKTLETNAGLVRNYIEAGQVLQRADLLEVGARTVAVLLRDFLDTESGLFHAALDPDEEYYAGDASARRTRQLPRGDGRFLADANARAVSALLKAGAVLRRPDITAAALTVSRAMVRRLWRSGRGMAHADDGSGPLHFGRLRDQAETARALLHVLQYTDDRRFSEVLAELVERIATVHLTARGDFADLGVGRDGTRDGEAIARSAVAAEVLMRAALFLGRPELADLARGALDVHAADHQRFGFSMAAYGRSVELLQHPPLHIVVVGRGDHPATSALFEAASTTYLPSRVVQHLDPVADGEILHRLELPPLSEPAVYVFLARESAAKHGDPETLWSVLAAANTRRLAGASARRAG